MLNKDDRMILATLSDVNYLANGLALYESLQNSCKNEFKLYYLCLDKETFNILYLLDLPHLSPIPLAFLKSPKLDMLTQNHESRPINISDGQSPYHWAMAPMFVNFILNEFRHNHCLYIDSDIYFYQDVKDVFASVNNYDIGLITHKHCALEKGRKNVGYYNVGIIYFNNSSFGSACCRWWRDVVIDTSNKWFNPYGSCGDQKYLEIFEDIFPYANIKILDKDIGHSAPWNLGPSKLTLENKEWWYDWESYNVLPQARHKQKLCFHHFSHFTYNYKSWSHQRSNEWGNCVDTPEKIKLHQDYFNMLHIVKENMTSKISFGMIVFNGNYVLQEALESVYPYATQILISEGPVEYWQSQGYTTSTDGTNDVLHEFYDPDKKLKIVHGQWSEKNEQCNAYMNYLDEDIDYVWNLDSDEIFQQKDLETIIKVLQQYQPTSVGFKSLSFYGGFDYYLTGFEEDAEFQRIGRVYPGAKWQTHRPPTIANSPWSRRHLDYNTLANLGIRMYHYSYVFPDQVKQKVQYYKAAVSKDNCIDNYFENIFLPWVTKPEQRQQIEQQYEGVHEFKPQYRGWCKAEEFKGTHPDIITTNLSKLQMKFNEQLHKYVA